MEDTSSLWNKFPLHSAAMHSGWTAVQQIDG